MKSLILGFSLVLISAAIGLMLPQLQINYLVSKRESIVLISNSLGSATGFFVKAPSGKNAFLTAAHVCNSMIKTFAAKISQDHDLCLVNPPIPEKPGLTLAKSVYDFERNWVFGYSWGEPLALTDGTFAGELAPEFTGELLQITTADGYPGASGSPVLNQFGHVVGVFVRVRNTNGFSHRGYIVPLGVIKEFLEGV